MAWAVLTRKALRDCVCRLQGEFGTDSLILPATLKRIADDLNRERRSRDWLRAASQGRTAERTIFHADSQQLATGKEGWYVAVSRARDDLRVITDDMAGLREAVGESRRQESALEAVERRPIGEGNVIEPEVQRIVSARTSSSRQQELER